jgi:hypothetical protein
MMNTDVATANHEVLSPAQRVIDPIVSIVAVGVLVSFFAAHQLAQTGFFTARFGALEMVCVRSHRVVTRRTHDQSSERPPYSSPTS